MVEVYGRVVTNELVINPRETLVVNAANLKN